MVGRSLASLAVTDQNASVARRIGPSQPLEITRKILLAVGSRTHSVPADLAYFVVPNVGRGSNLIRNFLGGNLTWHLRL